MCESDYIAHVVTLYIEINSKHRTLSSNFNSVTWRLSLVFKAFDTKKSTKICPRINCGQTKPFLPSRSNQYLHSNLWTHYFPLDEDSHLLASRFNLQYLRNIAKIGSIWLYDLNKPLRFLWHKDIILETFLQHMTAERQPILFRFMRKYLSSILSYHGESIRHQNK